MACGWTPDLMRMMEQMAIERDRHVAESSAELAAAAESLERRQKLQQASPSAQPPPPAPSVANSGSGSGSMDWTTVYDKWDTWEDPEELAQRERELRTKQDRLRQQQEQNAMGCNHDHSAEQALMDMTTEAKLDSCEAQATLGSAFFAQGQFQRAAYNYHRALTTFEYVFPDTTPEQIRLDTLRLRVLLNFTACRLRTGHLEDALHHATLALELDPENVKALYRRAQAHRRRHEFDESGRDLKNALDHATQSGEHAGLIRERMLLQAQVLAYKSKSRQMSSAMFPGDANKASRSQRHQQMTPLDSGMMLQLAMTPSRAVRPPLAALEKKSKSEPELEQARDDDDDESGMELESWRPCTSGLREMEQVLAGL